MERASTISTSVVRGLLLAVFAVYAFRAATLSITFEEADAFDRLVRPLLRDAVQQPDAASHWLNVLLVKRAVGLLGLSEFSFRLPTLLGGGFYLWAVYRLAQRTFAAVLLAPIPLVLPWTGEGIALALGLWAFVLLLSYQPDRPAKLNLAGLCLGLSVGASLTFAWPALALIAAFAVVVAIQGPAAGRGSAGPGVAGDAGSIGPVAGRGNAAPDIAGDARSIPFVERFVVTAVVTAFVLLIIPLSHAGAGPPKGASFAGVKSLVQVLRRETGGRKVRIGVGAGLGPALDFYRARYRAGNWEIAGYRAAGPFDYYVLGPAELATVTGRRLTVPYRDRDLVLAH